ncbi:MAG: peptidylprolyl isomerase SurA [Gammaproteobacteria bacterium]|nr:peptidylprolyl isomerase SurA [Gammaproteobacteria bacterium]
MAFEALKRNVARTCARLLALPLLLTGLAASAFQELDRVVAVVDDDVVLASELVERLQYIEQQFRANNMQVPPRDVLASQVLERLILDSIQMQMGRRAGVRIGDEELTQAVARVAQQAGMNLNQFQQALAQDGMSYADFREQIRREMIVGRVQQNRVSDRIYISPQELQNFLASPVGRAATSDDFRVGHILLAVPDDATPAAVREAEASAREIVAELRDGADFAQMAVARSADQRALEGGDLGWRKAGQLPSLFAEQVLGASKGQVLEPIRSASGFHIVKVLDKRGASNTVVDQTRARHILIQPSEIRSEREAENLIRDLYGRIQDGAAFDQLARDFSDDPGSALAGGDLGWIMTGQMVPAFEEVMGNTPTGRFSEPFRSQFGWHVLEVTDRRAQDMSTEFRERQAMRILQERRFDEALEAWLQEIRDEAYVEIRI